MSKRPIIGITGGFSKKLGPVGMYTVGGDYVKSVARAGGCPVVLTITEDPAQIAGYIDLIDGYVSPGGADMDPHFWGEDPIRSVSFFNTMQDEFEMALMKGCIEKSKPIFGICRGMQLLNVLLGGSLYQDIPTLLDTQQAHFGSMDARDALFHKVFFEPDSRLGKLMGTEIYSNSFHHQALNKIADGFTVCGRAADGVVEAFESERYRAFGVQFHPENLTERYPEFLKLFKALIDDCK